MMRRATVHSPLAGAVLVAAASAVSGCLLYDDRCGDESRDVTATTRFVEPWDPQAGYAQLQLVQHREQEPRESMWWLVLSDSLKGHIQAARLVDAGAQFAVLLELPVDSGGGNEALQGEMRPYQGTPEFEVLFDLVRSSRVAIELETDVTGREFLRQTLIVVRFDDWSRPHCG